MGARRVGYFLSLTIMILGVLAVPLGILFAVGGTFMALDTGDPEMFAGGMALIVTGSLMFIVGLILSIILKKSGSERQINLVINQSDIQEDIASQKQSIQFVESPRGPTKAWYLLPIFLLVVGGLVSFLLLRGRAPLMARNTLVVGLVLTSLLVLLVAAGAYTTVQDELPEPDLRPAGNAEQTVQDVTDSPATHNAASGSGGG